MVFSPDSSVLRTENLGQISSWLSKIPTIESNWPSLNQTFKTHAQRVRTIIFSPDNTYLASGSDDGTIQIWDNTTGEMYRELTVESARIKTIAFSPDSKKIVSGTGPSPSYNRTTVWEHMAAEAQRILVRHMGPVRTAFWPRGKQIVFSSCQKKIQIWDITTGDIQKTLTGHSGSVYSVAYSPDGGQIASGSFDRMIKIWNATTGEVQKTLLGHSCPVRSVAFSPDGKQIASGSSDSTIKIWNTTTGELQRTIPGHSGQVRSVVFSTDGKQLASGSRDRKVKLWDAVTGELQKTLVDHARSVNTVVFSPDGRYIASGSSDTVVNLWDTKTGGIKKVLATRASPKKDFHMMWSEEVHTLAFSPNGKSIVSGSDDSSIKVWDISMEDDQDIPESHLSWVMFVRFSPNGKQIVSGSIDGLNYLKFWDATTGDLQRTLKSEEIFLKAPPYAILTFLRAIPSFSFKISRLKTRHGFRVTNQWIFYEEYPILYLPPDFRPTCFDVLGDQIAVGFLSGRVLTFAIDRSRVQSILKEI